MAEIYTGRHVVVTGGAGALGRAVTRAFLESGAHVHIPVHGSSTADVAAAFASDRFAAVPGVDLSDADAVTAFYAELPDLWASVHLAGGFAMGKLGETTATDMQGMFSLNAMTCFLCCKAAVARMPAGGRIVNVTARPALEPRSGSGMVAYAASKAAVAAMTVALGEELVGSGILVNAVAPSIIDTAANRSAMPKADPAKWVTPETLAAAILFLASPANTATRGAVLTVYGRS
jgi:NAD(P)-dependent dehydrogenase (short-subunit alcohol dehydrogenase family)